MEISVSILSARNKLDAIKLLNDSNCDYIHIDVMDGKFVSNKMFMMNDISNFNKISTKKLDVHLMVSDPNSYIDYLGKLDMVEFITIHYEIDRDISFILNKIKSYGKKCGLAINPETDVDVLSSYAYILDMVLVMSVCPGMGGQKFIDSTYDKIYKIRSRYKDICISVDGGVNDSNYLSIKDSGASMIVVGSYVTGSDSYNKRIDSLK